MPYSISPLAGATAYVWTSPTGSHVSDGVRTSTGAALSTTFTSVTVNYGATAGNLLVQGTNACGRGTNKSVPITFNCLQRDVKTNTVKDVLDVVISPNPSTNIFNMIIRSNSKEAINIRVLDANGRIAYKTTGNVEQTYNFGENLANGLYLVEVRQGEKVKTVKAIKEK